MTHRLSRALLALPLLALIAWPAGALDLFNVKNSLIQFALEQISTDDFTITAETVESPGDGVTDLVGVAIADRQGVWFTAERMGLQWNARRILSAELEINRLAAEGVQVLRRPEGEVEVREDAAIAEDDGEPFDWPRAPIATRVEAIELTRVFIAEGVIAGQSLAFEATGAARDEGDEQSVRLDLTRTDAIAGRISLDYLRDFATNRLRAHLGAEEAAGGLVAELAGLPEDSASRVDLRADGPLTDWALDFEAETERVYAARGTATVDLEGPLAVAADFRLRPGPLLSREAAAVIGEEARLVVDVSEDATGVIAIREGRLASPALTLAADGSFDKATGAVALDISLEGRAALADLAEGVAFDRFGFVGRADGSLDDLTAEGQLSLAGLETAPADIASAELATTLTRRGEAIGLDLSGRAEGLRLDRLGPELLGAADLSIAGGFDDGRITLETLSLAARPLTLDAAGAVDLEAETAGLDYRASAPDLAPIARAYDVAAAGSFAVSGRAQGPLSRLALTGQAALERMVLDGTGLGAVRLSHDITLSEAIAGALRLSADGSPVGPLEADLDFTLEGDRLDLARFEAEAVGGRAEGTAVVALDTTLATGRLDIALPDLAALSALAGQPLSGALAGEVRLATPGGRQEVRADLEAEGLSGFEARLARADIAARLDDALGSPALDLEIDAEGGAWREARAGRLAGTVTGRDLTGRAAVVTYLTLTEAAGFGAEAARLSVEAEIADAARLGAVTAAIEGDDLGFEGNRVARITADLEAADGLSARPSGEARLTARDIRAGPARIASADLTARATPETDGLRAEADLRLGTIRAEGAEISGARLAARAADALGDPRLSARLSTGEITAAEARLEAAEATLEGALSALVATLSTRGEAAGDPVSLDARAEIDAATDAPRIRLTRAEAVFGEAELSLASPLRITAGQSIEIEAIDLTLPGGSLRGDAALHPTGIAADLALAVADLAPLAALAEAPLTAGGLEARVSADTRPGRASGRIEARARGLAFEDTLADLGGLGAEITGDWDGRRADLEAEITGSFGSPIRAEAGLPLRAPGGVPALQPDGALQGRIRWQGDVGAFWALVPAPGHVLDGALALDLGIQGTPADPALAGSIALSDGRYENLDLGTILTDLTLSSRLVPETGGIALELSAGDGARGEIGAEIAVDAERVDATLTGREAVLVRRDDATAAISLDIEAAGPLAGPDISGTVTVDRAEIRLVNATPPSVVTLDDVRIKGEPVPEPDVPEGGAIGLDVAIRGERDIYVRGRGLDSEWRIGLDVTGTAAAPDIRGSVERVRGRLSLVGTAFELTEGEVSFPGGPEIAPRVNIRLTAEENGVTGGIAVTGPASAPRIGFWSRQGLPEDEVLPRILFGKPSQSLTASQAIRLASGVATLLDGSGGIVDDVRGTIGLDELSIDPTEDSAEVTVGKNLSDEVFVGAKQSVDGAESKVVVEVEVFENVIVDSEIDQEGAASVGVQWRTDF